LKNATANIAVIINQILKNHLWLNFFNFIKYQLINIQIQSKIGFITFDQRGVLAANKTFHPISHTINTNASGQLVINHVILPTHFTFFNADNISSILNHIRTIKTMIHDAQRNDSLIFHHNNIADHTKNNNVNHHTIKSNFCSDSNNSFFILIIKFK